MGGCIFKAKRKDNGDEVEGYYIETGGKGFMFGMDIISPMIFVSTTFPLSSIPIVEVDPVTLSMYTGLKDKNGVKIFGAIGEKGGDIMNHEAQNEH